MLTTEQKELIKGTVPVLRESGVALTTHFYNRMFTHNPELKNIFNANNQQTGKQQTALAMAVLAYAENIEDPSVLLPVVNKVGHKHVSLGIRPEHYAIVGKHLIASIQEVLGDGASPALLQAWTKAYDQLAKIFVQEESSLYQESVDKEGGWTGWRPFSVKKKVKESEEITSFYLYPSDGGKVAGYTPGQYISVHVFLPELELFQARQYSLSNAPNGEYYRISVKKEVHTDEVPGGLISNHLHDHIQEGDIIELAAPAGDFTIDVNRKNPVVFISGGVGQTPLMSMLESILLNDQAREVVWVHGCRNEEVHAFKEVVDQWLSDRENRKKHIFYDRLKDVADDACHEGVVDVRKLSDDVIIPGADYYVCGPGPFIEKQFVDLKELGVDPNSIHYEEFGPHVLSLQ